MLGTSPEEQQRTAVVAITDAASTTPPAIATVLVKTHAPSTVSAAPTASAKRANRHSLTGRKQRLNTLYSSSSRRSSSSDVPRVLVQ